ncbi:16S rRNA (guanine(527)-N(7))-methyltransferase RsmG [Cohnella rhizosphaerae]|uniref:Ribosomal RNA small subunit methyltransferase G n=1 Tax=Cohnella rhizosphaerae TaxID=1457232 RepID=A0A9X4KUA2_9BACL|nr:16S rRNA (guanine(527)-N(7))-methyltransferase RsmG [Cohnella rhizosphaerae]MDG0811022.1 16S rRNA (guanine(527)-N(7))-methyltransferase RsmG [Cohnella rhizosphaerae]
MADELQRWFGERVEADLGIELSDAQLDQYESYYRLLVEWNEKMNLTGITDRGAVYEKHFYDSLTLAVLPEAVSARSLADIGAGAGFPSIPFKIAFPQLEVTIVDSLAKRIRFLQTVADELHLSSITLVHGRAEDIGRLGEHRDRYDLVTARAVARLAGLNELCLPFAKVDGHFIAMKGSDHKAELEESVKSIRLLNAKLRYTRELKLPLEQSERQLIVIGKLGRTPKEYPRKAGIPLKQPLI